MDPDEIEALGPLPRGRRADAAVDTESAHFGLCPVCGQAFDRRDLAQVLRHDDPDHAPEPRN